MVSFTSTVLAAFAALAISQAEAGFIGKMLGGKKRDILSARSAGHIWSRASSLEQSFNDCMTKASEVLVVSKVGSNFKLSAQDGSFPQSCVVVANSYIGTSQTDGALRKEGNSYILTPKAKDVASLNALVGKN
ncbi:hypothetical protein B0O99DRAFT_681626 [Bisporella sp. PMI_857]|nr:hypothetical protein B0O99DRAFT_681626 [Bisporella sp. PMI_857]